MILARRCRVALLHCPQTNDKFACQEAIEDYLIEKQDRTYNYRSNWTNGVKGMFHIEEDRAYISQHEYEWFVRSDQMFRDIFNLT